MYRILFFLLLCPVLTAQTIELDMPRHYALPYMLTIEEGSRKDTVAKGRLNMLGKAIFSLPQSHKAYRGVARLTIEHTNEDPVGIIINGEERILLRGDSVYSVENNFLRNAMKEQRIKGYSLHLEDNKLYAARVMEILNCLSQQETNEIQRDYIINRLDFTDLYTSGFWQLMMEIYYQTFSNDDTLLLDTTKAILDKTEDVIVRRELTQSIILLFSKYGKDNLLMELGSEYLTIPINGKAAPALITGDIPIQPKQCLIFFYDSDCGLCHYEMHQLIEKYSFLNNEHNQIEVISVAADIKKEDFEYNAQKMPWKEKLCDLKGFDGKNFENYGIVGTPTLILVDKEGIVRGRHMRLSEFLK